MSTISLKDVTRKMDDAAEPFSIVYYDCNRTKKTGGRIIRVESARKCGLPYHCNDHEMRGLINLESGKTSAVHMRLIAEFNNQQVFW